MSVPAAISLWNESFSHIATVVDKDSIGRDTGTLKLYGRGEAQDLYRMMWRKNFATSYLLMKVEKNDTRYMIGYM